MIELSEEYRGRKSIYTRMIVDEDGVVVSMETVDFRAVHVQKDNKDYFVIYDQNMIPIRDAFRYLNFSMQHLSYNSREQAMHALKLLFSYLALTKTDINHMSRSDVNNLIHFLLGYSPSMGSVSMKLLTTRRNATVNDYLTTYRSYFKDCGIECDYLTKNSVTTTLMKTSSEKQTRQSVNSYMNRIIKSTLLLLLKAKISAARKKEIKKLLVFFGEVETLDVHTINWSIRFNRNNQSYRMLVAVCELVIKGLLQTQSDGSTKMMDFLDDQKMHHLYEKFILEYYNTEYKHLKVKASASMMDWQVDDDFRDLLPKMKTDITLTCGERTLIIDAKYYERNLREQYGKVSIPTDNLYQIFTYVKTKENELADVPHEKVSGMLLYAQTEEEGAFNNEYQMMGNRVCVRTLDLSGDFQSIKRQLDEIAEKYLLVKAA